MKWFSILLLGSCCFFSRAFETRETSNPVRKIRVFEVENDVFRLHFNPMGGRLDSFFFKKIGSDLTNPETIGSGTENFWNVRESRFFLQDKPFIMTPHEGKDSFSVEMTGQHRGGGIDFLRVRKTYTLRNNETLLSIGYEFENMPDAMTNMNYAPLIHHCLGVLRSREIISIRRQTASGKSEPENGRRNSMCIALRAAGSPCPMPPVTALRRL